MESINDLLSINCENSGWPKIEVIEFKWWKRKSSYSKEHPELNGKNEQNHPAKFPESHVNRGKGGENLLTNPSQIEIKRGMPP